MRFLFWRVRERRRTIDEIFETVVVVDETIWKLAFSEGCVGCL